MQCVLLGWKKMSVKALLRMIGQIWEWILSDAWHPTSPHLTSSSVGSVTWLYVKQHTGKPIFPHANWWERELSLQASQRQVPRHLSYVKMTLFEKLLCANLNLWNLPTAHSYWRECPCSQKCLWKHLGFVKRRAVWQLTLKELGTHNNGNNDGSEMCVHTYTHTQTVIHNVGNVKTFGILLLGEGHTGVHWHYCNFSIHLKVSRIKCWGEIYF